MKEVGTGRDAENGKLTYVKLFGVEESRRQARELCDGAVRALAGFDARAEPLRAIARYTVERER